MKRRETNARFKKKKKKESLLCRSHVRKAWRGKENRVKFRGQCARIGRGKGEKLNTHWRAENPKGAQCGEPCQELGTTTPRPQFEKIKVSYSEKRLCIGRERKGEN